MTTIGIVGLGLIGGSLALRAKAVDPSVQVIGMSRSHETVRYALDHGIVDRVASAYSDFNGADIIFVCTPIPTIFDTLVALDNELVSPTILTDVASLKGELFDQVSSRSWRHSVVLGHPMAGKEISGVAAADSTLLLGKTYILINDLDGKLSQFISTIGCVVLNMSADDHDRMVGYASHLPYLGAVMVAGIAGEKVDDWALFSKIAASGFRDTTRVSASDPNWGVDVLLGNKAVVLEGITTAQALLSDLKTIIESGDADELLGKLNTIRDFRNRI